MSAARTVHVVVPAGIADPRRPSGGNTYDRRVCQGLTSAGWSVKVRQVAGDWPWADDVARGRLAGALEDAPDGSVVLLDGLVSSASPEQLAASGRRLRTVVLMHMPLGAGGDRVDRRQEEAALRAATAVVTTSNWTLRWLLEAYGLDPSRLHVAHPGVDTAASAGASTDGANLLCVAAVTPGKGHDVLVAALASLRRVRWQCVCVGSLSLASEHVAALRQQVREAGLEGRVRFVGPRTGAALDEAYAAADLLVLASRAETYGMVVTEALARGLPVLACDVGGVPEALGTTTDGDRPGLLVPPGDGDAIADALRGWLGDPAMRTRLHTAAARRRTTLTGWDRTADRVARVLEAVAA